MAEAEAVRSAAMINVQDGARGDSPADNIFVEIKNVKTASH